MKKSLACAWLSGALVASLSFVAPASAGGCGAIFAPVRPATCIYQGDYMVDQGPKYDGPALIAPQPTYSPSRTVGGWGYEYRPAVTARAQAPVDRAQRMEIRRYW